MAMDRLASTFSNLVVLTLIDVGLHDDGLEALCKKLSPTVEKLDISENHISNLAPLVNLSASLKHLVLFNVYKVLESSIHVLMHDLSALQHLDISRTPEQVLDLAEHLNIAPLNIRKLLSRKGESFENLVFLDLSGWSELDTELVSEFLEVHPKISFIGLALIYRGFEENMSNNLGHVICWSMDGESGAVECLKRYKSRSYYAKRALLFLYQSTKQNEDARHDLLLLLVDIMWLHMDAPNVLMAATACLYNLTNTSVIQRLHTEHLKRAASVVLCCMKRYPCTEVLQKNCLLTLCCEQILSEVTFDKYECIELCLKCLCKFDDQPISRMCLAITSILSSKIPIASTSALASNQQYMLCILEITRKKLEEVSTGPVMSFALSALWNLTDESPKACWCFFDLQGLDLALECLTKYESVKSESERLQMQIKVVGLLNNIAEVTDLRGRLILDVFIELLRNSIKSSNGEYAYFSAGILANLILDSKPTQDLVEREMITAISSWPNPKTAMVAYRSLNAFRPLLYSCAPIASQYWAVWAINHVCSADGNRYVAMVRSDGIYDDIKNISMREDDSCKNLIELAQILTLKLDGHDLPENLYSEMYCALNASS